MCMKLLLPILIFLTVLTSCSTECQNNFLNNYNRRSVSYSATDNTYDVFYPEYDGKATYLTVNVDNLNSQDVYFIFSNVSMDQSDSNPTVSGHSASEIRDQISRQLIANTTYDKPTSRGSTVTPLRDTVGDTKYFWIDQNNTGTIRQKACTCLQTVEVGDKQLSVWMQDSINQSSSSFLPGMPSRSKTVITGEMAQAISDVFLQDGDNNDIYDWVTNIYGEEWGEHSSTNLIEPNNNITILLVDDEADSSTITLGYFWSKDNYKSSTQSNSNERIMFYVNGNYYAKVSDGETSWSASNKCPSTIHSTLAHEFQHMIHFYNKIVKNENTTLSSTWLNEMCSLVTEDFVADKLGVYGPRGRKTAECTYYHNLYNNLGIKSSEDYNIGRIPYFNDYNDRLPIFGWGSSDSAYRYSIAYAFGAYLARNYGGPQLFRDIVQDKTVSDSVIFTLTGSNLETLLRKWGVACMLSNLTDVENGLKYNNGSSWMSYEIDGISYNLGSINLFNYVSSPNIYTATSSSERSVGSSYSLGASTNRYARAAERKTGTLTKYVKLESHTALTIVVR